MSPPGFPPWLRRVLAKQRSRRKRPEIRGLTPVHIAIRVRKGTPRLRHKRFLRIVRGALTVANSKFRFRVIEFSLQGNHLHIIAEAEDTYAVSRAVRGISIRIAKRVNAELGESGVRIAERYFMAVMRTPLETFLTLRYVLNNYRRHAADRNEHLSVDWVDPFSSAPWFDGWRRQPRRSRDPCPDVERGTTRARSILLTSHWRLYGLLEPSHVPGPSLNTRVPRRPRTDRDWRPALLGR